MLHSIWRFPLTFFTLLIFFVTNAAGQQTYNMPAVVQPSPQSQAFIRYGDYPMADYAGLTDITIPIHTITGRNLSLPISMGFHASGRMADEINGALGMRWTLNCGGLITRTVKGYPDEWNNLTPYVVDPYIVPNFDTLFNACPDGRIHASRPFYDSEFDLFSYALPNGKHGHFILKNVNGVKIPMLIPYSSLKIELFTVTNEDGYYDRIEITDVDGTKYIFGKVDAATEGAIETSYLDVETRLGRINTAWYLTKIISSDGADEISLSYSSRYSMVYNASQSANIGDDIRNSSVSFDIGDCELDPYECNLRDYIITYHFDQDNDVVYNFTNQTVPALTGIQFSGGSVVFNYASSDLSDPLLSEMIIDNGSVPYKRVKFNMTKPKMKKENRL